MSRTITLRERARGALLGLACGDALGAQVEFMPRDSFPRQTELKGGGPHHLAVGEWTDDTAMALALAESLIECDGWRPEDAMGRWVRWMRHGDYSCTGTCFDIGSRTRSALSAYERGGMSALMDVPGYAEGNGSLMRVAPVALLMHRNPLRATTVASQQSHLTHGRIAADQCAAFVRLLGLMLTGVPFSSLLEMSPIMADIGARRRHEVSSEGRAADTHAAAIWSLVQTRTCEEAIVTAVNLGHDSDTVGAVTGALAGALYGASALPERWTRRLAWRSRLVQTADTLIERCGGDPDRP